MWCIVTCGARDYNQLRPYPTSSKNLVCCRSREVECDELNFHASLNRYSDLYSGVM